MDLTQPLEQLTVCRKNLDSAIKLLKEISRLEPNRMQNLLQLRARLIALDKLVEQLSQSPCPLEDLVAWIGQYEEDIAKSEEENQRRFGVELEQELQKIGLSLSGQYPDLKAGLFTIELDSDKSRATLWYGPKQERLDQCRLLATEVANRIEKVRQQLGSHLSEDEFLEKLREAYSRAIGSERGEPAPIIKVLAELAYLLQSPAFCQDPRRDNYRGYSRADFSYDLFQARHHSGRLHLTVATRDHTRRRQDFLWVSDDESGRGTAYSHLQFKEAIS